MRKKSVENFYKVFDEFVPEMIERIQEYLEGRDGIGLLFPAERVEDQTRADNFRNTGYISFHDGHVEYGLYASAPYLRNFPDLPQRVMRLVRAQLDEVFFQAVREVEEDESLTEDECLAAFEEKFGTEQFWSEQYEEEKAWLWSDDENPHLIRIGATFDARRDEIHLLFSINLDAPYYRRYISFLPAGCREQEVPLWERVVPARKAEEALTELAAFIDKEF